jgi:hypothetical protein
MNTVRFAQEKDIPAILKLLVQVDMVHHRGRPDIFKGPATKYNEEELKNVANENESYRVDINNIVTNIHSQVISIDSRSENGSIDLDCSHINDSILIIEVVEFKKVQ